jgi:uridine kinase
VVTAVLDLLASREPTLADGRLLCIDGPAGSGKTTLAAQVQAVTGAPVLRMDDLYPGWDGLGEVEPHVLGILAPLAAGRPGRYRRYDWHADAFAEEHQVDPAPLVVLEGVGSGSLAWSSWITVLVWVEADPQLRLARGLERDGEAVREQWLAWMRAEQELFARDRIRERADLVIWT